VPALGGKLFDTDAGESVVTTSAVQHIASMVLLRIRCTLADPAFRPSSPPIPTHAPAGGARPMSPPIPTHQPLAPAPEPAAEPAVGGISRRDQIYEEKRRRKAAARSGSQADAAPPAAQGPVPEPAPAPLAAPPKERAASPPDPGELVVLVFSSATEAARCANGLTITDSPVRAQSSSASCRPRWASWPTCARGLCSTRSAGRRWRGAWSRCR
jgi:hypothetical protein